MGLPYYDEARVGKASIGSEDGDVGDVASMYALVMY
jgi:hypothetical protein